MDQLFRLFVSPTGLNSPAEVIEWQFTERDLRFLEHQYNQGVVSRQSNASLSLVIGTAAVHRGPEALRAVDPETPVEALDDLFVSGAESPSGTWRVTSGKAINDMTVTLSIINGDLLINFTTPSTLSGERSVMIPFSDLEISFQTVECDDPTLDNGWYRSEVIPFAMTKKTDPLAEYELSLSKVVNYQAEEKVRVLARSKEEAHSKGVDLAHDLEYRQGRTHYFIDHIARK